MEVFISIPQPASGNPIYGEGLHTPVRKLLVLGATGGTGVHVVTQALEQGYEVTALAHRPERASSLPRQARIVVGSVTDDDGIPADAVRGQDVVISALGRGLSLRSDGLMARAVPRIVEAMERHGVVRLIFTSAYGVGDTWRDVPPLSRIFAWLALRDIYADKAAGEASLVCSGLDWTLVYPVTLTNGPRTGRWRAGERLALRGVPRITRADLAAFLLAQVEDRSYCRKGVLVAADG
jgi:putative NADH-flavin reductase